MATDGADQRRVDLYKLVIGRVGEPAVGCLTGDRHVAPEKGMEDLGPVFADPQTNSEILWREKIRDESKNLCRESIREPLDDHCAKSMLRNEKRSDDQ